MLDGEHGIALHTMLENRASSRDEGEFSWFFLSCGRNLGYILELWQERFFKTRVCTVTSGLLSSYEGQLINVLEAGQGNVDASRGETGNPGSLFSCHSDIGIPIIFQEESGIDTF